MRLIIVSNRLPLTISLENNQYIFKKSYGGLATGLSSFLERYQGSDSNESLWLGWPGISEGTKNQEAVKKYLIEENNCYPVFLDESLIESYYNGFCNQTLWPLFHEFISFTKKEPQSWEAYKEANLRYFHHIAPLITSGDAIWVHDYHLMLLPHLIKQHFPKIPVGFFLHTPFPSHTFFSHLETIWQKELIQGILSADIVGFHTDEYVNNFLQTVHSLFPKRNKVSHKTGVFPIGIDHEYFTDIAKGEETKKKVEQYKVLFKNQRILLSVDRLDYIKGIKNRLQGYEEFLRLNPSFRQKVTLIVIAAPSRPDIWSSKKTKQEIEQLVYKINKKFGTSVWKPVIYEYKGYPLEELAALYALADVMLVTSIRDGMNLVAKEFVACKTDHTGVLILSKTAGAANQLKQALIINPHDISEIAKNIHTALKMSQEEQIKRNTLMRKSVQKEDIFHWANQFIDQLLSTQSRDMISNGPQRNSEQL